MILTITLLKVLSIILLLMMIVILYSVFHISGEFSEQERNYESMDEGKDYEDY